MMIIKLTLGQTERCLQRLHQYLDAHGPWEDAGFLDLAGIKKIGLMDILGDKIRVIG